MDVTLSWTTFRQAANQAGLSRRFGGIHFRQADVDARRAGRLVAGRAWERAQSYIEGGCRASTQGCADTRARAGRVVEWPVADDVPE
jgi:hypothetical protein